MSDHSSPSPDPAGSTQPAAEPAQTALHRRGRCCRALRRRCFQGLRCGHSVGVRRRRRRDRHVRLELLGRGAEEGDRRTSSRTSPRRRASPSRSTRSTTTPSRSRSTATCRGSRTTSSRGSPGTGCSSSRRRASRRRSTTSGRCLRRRCRPAFKGASTGLDGHQYFVPIYNYPWAVFYRKSVFAKNGYKVPKTWDQFIALAKKMQADGLTPIAFTDKDGWPAMGTFDILNMRINGYAVPRRSHGRKARRGTAPKVKAVFNQWKELLPYYSAGALGLTWQEGAQQLVNKQAGMFLLGSFVGQQFTSAADHADLDFFPYPAINPKWGQDSLDAPIDGFMLSKKPKNLDGAKAAARPTSAARPPRTRTSRPTRTTSRRTSTPSTAHYNAAAEEGGEADRRRRSTSRSTWTATRGRTSPPR